MNDRRGFRAGLALAALVLAGSAEGAVLRAGGIVVEYDARSGALSLLRGPAGQEIAADGGLSVQFWKEGGAAGRWTAPGEFAPESVTLERGALKCSYRGPEGVTATTTLSGRERGVLEWTAEVANGGKTPILRVRGPVLKNVVFTAGGKQDEMLYPLHTTVLARNPSADLENLPPIHYPRGCVNFLDLSGGGRGCALLGDPSMVMNEFGIARGAAEGGLDLWVETVNAIPPGGAAVCRWSVYLHDGDWRRAGELYRTRFLRAFGMPTYPRWLRDSNGFLSINWGSDFLPAYGKETANHINEAWRLGLDHIQFWGQTGTHACPGYPLADPLRGGEEGMARMFGAIRAAGMHTGGYMWSCGIGKFEVLSKTHRGIPWSDFPAEVRPPSWQWVVENSVYGDPSRTPPTTEMASNAWKRANVKTVEEAEAKRLVPQVLHTLSFLSPGFRDWLKFWVSRYVQVYGADVAYLDVYGFRPKTPEFNPYLKLFGDGTEGRFRLAFLKELQDSLRTREPGFAMITEGVLDAYATRAAGVVSNFRKHMEGYRWLFPEHVLYEGNNNGQMFGGASLKALSNAFLDGNRFDLMLPFCCYTETERIVWLRDSLMPWVASGRYLGRRGFRFSDPRVEGALTDGREGPGGYLLTVRNIERVAGARVAFDEGFPAGADGAFAISLDGSVRRWTFPGEPIEIPATPVSAILLTAGESRQGVLPLVFPRMTPAGIRYDVSAVNVGRKRTPVRFGVSVAAKRPGWEIGSRESAPGETVSLVWTPPVELAGERTERLLFDVSWTGGGRTFRRTYDPPVEDPHCEWNERLPLTDREAKDGSRSIIVEAGHEKVLLKLAPRTKYRLRVAALRRDPVKTGAAVFDPKLRVGVANFKETVPAEGRWGEVGGEFSTGDEGWLNLYLYNRGSGPVFYDDIRIEPAG